MTGLNNKDITYIANLAKLKLSSEEIIKFKKQLSNIIGYIDHLKEVDTSKVKPTSQTTNLQNVTRTDKVGSGFSLTQNEALSGEDDTHNGYFKVSAILEKDQ
ncbi:MAG TPA: Asp-tRNA(Asn)/Glu-tRNA(Gln) amidotransferase subunit GatC [Patescibacteria group bacterium]|nr:Asp-tRNA(Asn)/Glu-tRNA(Gln) amidotransferase subunit GatC [Patescibacteria group bacterium]